MLETVAKHVNIISLIISIIIFLFINLILSIFTIPNATFKAEFSTSQAVSNTNASTKQEQNVENKSENLIKNDSWYIEIPKINLSAPIEEGTTDEVLNQFVGHFEETSKSTGNIGLAAHNRGYSKNYFENLKKLQIGDEIVYHYQDFTKKYIVKKHEIIKDTNWEYLGSSKEINKITLITCVENEPNYRRCIQAEEAQN